MLHGELLQHFMPTERCTRARARTPALARHGCVAAGAVMASRYAWQGTPPGSVDLVPPPKLCSPL